MDVPKFAALVIHLLCAAAWFGAMLYSLAVVQPRSRRFLDDERGEQFAATLASGARYPVLALIAAIAISGGALLALEGEGHGHAWWAVIAMKAVALLGATAIFAWVSWRLWPERLFAGPAELPTVRRAFRRAALVLTTLVTAALILSAAARALG